MLNFINDAIGNFGSLHDSLSDINDMFESVTAGMS